MPTKTLSVSGSGSAGITAYNWTYVQSTGSIVAGTSIVPNNANTVVFTTPSTITYAGTLSGSYKFDFTVTATDGGVLGCTAVRTISLYYNDSIPTCNLAISPISVV
jgi:hypothetical protein